ncbi:hypothetical protein SLEP1_g758 [Rubroshorea leprosula]|uniref:Uncharacterized protein n=1 Tax=Rubroshorea leprosula TaxID=152421 RepID=A0AAV5HKC4_9ROSI|nr:hypothetical protein SLEP1_g758 [Rubroshorea leprosula]
MKRKGMNCSKLTALHIYVETIPQQSYAQPAAASTLTPAQQPASVPQPYYGNYY